MLKKYTYDIYVEAILYIITALYIVVGGVTSNMHYVTDAILTILVMMAPRIVMKIFKFKASPFLNFIVQFFIFVSMFLGRLNNYYLKFSWWDLFLHALSGIIIFLVAYMIFMIQNDYRVDNVNIALIVTYTFLFAVAMTAIWEMWEFAGDSLFGLNSQGASLQDTMEDIIAGSTGPLLMIPFLISYLKGKKNILFNDLTNFMKENNKSLKS